MKLPFSVLYPFLLALAFCLPDSRAADTTAADLQPGVRLLEAELVPSRVTLLTAKCDQLVIAVGKTTLEHPDNALSILHAALTRGVVKKRAHGEGEAEMLLPCACARRIFLASVAAAPRRASDILDLATLLYPDCTPEFADALRAYDARGRVTLNFDAPAGTDLGDAGFGVGFGPGFPGTPGFTGSAPSGSTALPGGILTPPGAITAVVNG